VYQGVLQLSRTVADLAGEENIQSQHLAVALK
jgi:predicted ATPase with chaperone activity